MFDLAEEALDQVAVLVQERAESQHLFAVGHRLHVRPRPPARPSGSAARHCRRPDHPAGSGPRPTRPAVARAKRLHAQIIDDVRHVHFRDPWRKR